jgi:hypothetical protein
MRLFRPFEEPRLVLHVTGATAEQLERGVAAAQEYFKAEAVDPAETWIARIKIEDEDIGVPDIVLSDREEQIWHHWHEAETRALVACCDAGNVPPYSCLEWRKSKARAA